MTFSRSTHNKSEFSLGMDKYYKKDYIDAVAHFNEALQEDCENSNAYYFRAHSLCHLNRESEANRDFAKAAELNPKFA